jgi:enoyl-CoA hydratase/carnithine racemase
MADLEYSVAESIATIRLNRPQRKNAFTLAMVDEWAARLLAAQADPDVRVIVVTGAGDAFCSGVDLSEFKGEVRTPLGEKELLRGRVHRVALALEAIDKPVLAAVNGVAVGAGMDMALLCDMRFGGPGTRFSEGYIKVGLVPGDGGCWLLPRVVGMSTALRLLWTGDFVDSETALRLGLVDELGEDAYETAMAMARRLAAQPPVTVQVIKRAVRQGARHDLPTALDLISSHMAVVAATADSAEAYAAFVERRAATFIGR